MTQEQTQKKSHLFEFQIPAIYTPDPVDIEKMLWKSSQLHPESYVHWKSDCCGGTKVIYAPDDQGHVWFILVSSTRAQGRDVVRIDNADEVMEVLEAFPCVADRFLLEGWYEAGLKDVLLGFFTS